VYGSTKAVLIHATYSDDLDATYADLASESTWRTGSVIHVDGGQVLGLPESAGG